MLRERGRDREVREGGEREWGVHIHGSFSWKLDQRGCRFPDEIKINLKHESFKLPLYFWCSVFGEIREMPQWVNASLFLALWAFIGRNCDIFMAAICDMALRRLADHRYFLWIIHDWIKTGFMRKKEASSYIQMVFIVCCLLLTAPNKGKTVSVSHITDGVFWVCIMILWLVHNRN